MKKNKTLTTRIVQTVAVVLSVVFMLCDKSVAVRRFETEANGLRKEIIVNTDFFDMTLIKGGNWIPMIAASLTCLLLVCVLLSFLFKESKIISGAMCVLSLASLVMVLLPIAQFGIGFFTRLSMLIAYLLGCSLLFSVQHLTGRYFRTFDDDEE